MVVVRRRFESVGDSGSVSWSARLPRADRVLGGVSSASGSGAAARLEGRLERVDRAAEEAVAVVVAAAAAAAAVAVAVGCTSVSLVTVWCTSRFGEALGSGARFRGLGGWRALRERDCFDARGGVGLN